MSLLPSSSAHQILSEPDPARRIDIDAHTDPVERSTGQVDAMPACWRLIDHTLLHEIDVLPLRWVWPRKANALAAVRIANEAFISDTLALCAPVGAGMAEATVIHVPAMQARSPCQRIVPGKWVKTSNGPVMIDQSKELLGELYLQRCQWRRRPIGGSSYTSARN